MPEGDSLHRAANRLRPALAGATLERFEAPTLRGARPRLGSRIEAVDAVGKHLLIRFDDRLVLRTHLGMPGRWDLYRRGERWRRPRRLLRVLVGVDGWDAVCFAAPEVATHRTDAAGATAAFDRNPVASLGPDLCTPTIDLDEAAARLGSAADPATAIADVLLDQRVVAGIGNVYKSEVLHLCRIDPFLAAGEVAPEVRRRLVGVANRLLLANLTTARRTTVAGPPGTLAVYRRTGRPCRTCGTPIRRTDQGPHRRGTWWCPRCQPPGAGRTTG